VEIEVNLTTFLGNIRYQALNRRILTAKFMCAIIWDEIEPFCIDGGAKRFQTLKFRDTAFAGKKLIASSKLDAKSARIDKTRDLRILQAVCRAFP
jgi:hypothetical protein